MHATPNGKPVVAVQRHVVVDPAAVVADAHLQVLRVAARQAVAVVAQAMVKRHDHARVVAAAVGSYSSYRRALAAKVSCRNASPNRA